MTITLDEAPTRIASPASAPEHSVELPNPQTESAGVSSLPDADSGRLEPLFTAVTANQRQPPRALKPLRFAFGMLLTGCGMSMILLIGIRMIEVRLIGGDFAMPLVAMGALTGVMLLGGGFGIMATSSSGFDEGEFDRLAEAGNISALETLQDKFVPVQDNDEPIVVMQTRRRA